MLVDEIEESVVAEIEERGLFRMSSDAVGSVAATAALTGVATGVTVVSGSADASTVVEAIREQTQTASTEHQELMGAFVEVLDKATELLAHIEGSGER